MSSREPEPDPRELQRLLAELTPDPYFVRHQSVHGFYLLRSKSRLSRYRGLHLVVFPNGRSEVIDVLSRRDGSEAAVLADQPFGRSWFIVYSSLHKMKRWSALRFVTAGAIPHGTLVVDYRWGFPVSLSANRSTFDWLRSAVGAATSSRLDVTLLRAGKEGVSGVKNPPGLWLWSMPEKRSDLPSP